MNPAANLHPIECTVAAPALRSIVSDDTGRRILVLTETAPRLEASR